MRLHEIELTNFKSFGEHPTQVRFEPGVNVLTGPNGAGKSTVLQAVGLGLFQRTPEGSSLRTLGRLGGGAWRIRLLFEDSGRRRYRLERTEKTCLLLDEERGEELAKGVRATSETLATILEIDRDLPPPELFRRILCCAQGDYTRDLELPAPARRQLFDPLFKVDRLKAMDARLEPVTGNGRLVRNLVQPLEDQVRDLRRRARPLEHTEERRDELERAMHAGVRRREEVAAELRRARSDLEALVDQQGELSRLHQEAGLRRQARDSKAGQLDEARRRLDEATESRLRREACQGAAERYQRAQEELRELEPRRQRGTRLRAELADLESARAAALLALDDRSSRREALRERLAQDRARLEEMEALLARLGDRVEHIDGDSRREEVALETARGHLVRAREALLASVQSHRELQALEEELEDRRQRLDTLEERARLASANPEEQGRLPQLSDGLVRLRHRHSKILGQLELLEKERVLLGRGQCPFVSRECPGLAGVALPEELERLIAELNQRRYELDREIEEYENWLVKAEKAESTRSQGETAAQQARQLAEDVARAEERIRGRLEELSPSRAVEGLLEATRLLDRVDEPRADLRAGLERLRTATPHSVGRAGGPLEATRGLLRELEERIRDASQRRQASRSTLRDTQEETTRLDEKVRHLRGRIDESEAESLREASSSAEVEERLRQLEGDLEHLRVDAAPYRNLEEEEARLREVRASTEPDYHEWLRLETAALDEPARRERVETLEREARHLDEELEQLERRMSAATREARDAAAIQQLEALRDEFTAAESRLAVEVQRDLDAVEALDAELAAMRAARVQAAGLQAEVDSYRRAADLISGLCRVLRSAAPRLAGRYLREVSREATRGYQALSPEAPAEVVWREDYQVELRGPFGSLGEVRAVELPALSGGEQRAVALALRLAMTRVLCPADVLLLDEPTAHLDGPHRRRLATLLATASRELGIDQLIVVTHDDSFDGIPRHRIHLDKQEGASQVLRAPGE